MIEITKLSGQRITVNADHIESVEAQPDTALLLSNGKQFMVKEPVSEIVRRVIEYKRLVNSGPAQSAAALE